MNRNVCVSAIALIFEGIPGGKVARPIRYRVGQGAGKVPLDKPADFLSILFVALRSILRAITL